MSGQPLRLVASSQTLEAIKNMAMSEAEQGAGRDGGPALDAWLALYAAVAGVMALSEGTNNPMSDQQATTAERKPIPGIIEGRMVHYVIPKGQKNAGQHRAATICRVWDTTTGLCNLHVFWDGNNDNADDRGPWLGSIYYSDDKLPNTWHWMERA